MKRWSPPGAAGRGVSHLHGEQGIEISLTNLSLGFGFGRMVGRAMGVMPLPRRMGHAPSTRNPTERPASRDSFIRVLLLNRDTPTPLMKAVRPRSEVTHSAGGGTA